jgi:hypothetical protein
MEYPITPPEPIDWRIDESDFIEHLSKQWSEIEIQKGRNLDNCYSIEWVIKVPGMGQRLDGTLHRYG